MNIKLKIALIVILSYVLVILIAMFVNRNFGQLGSMITGIVVTVVAVSYATLNFTNPIVMYYNVIRYYGLKNSIKNEVTYQDMLFNIAMSINKRIN